MDSIPSAHIGRGLAGFPRPMSFAFSPEDEHIFARARELFNEYSLSPADRDCAITMLAAAASLAWFEVLILLGWKSLKL